MTSDTALIIIDVQNDFCSGGALEVPNGDAVVPVINALGQRFARQVLTQDWHPSDHQSFASAHPGREPFEMATMSYGEQVLWPDHCVMDSHGAMFHGELLTTRAQWVVRKGFRAEIDSYSAFFENDRTTPTGLEGALKSIGVSQLYLAGLATDFCVAYTALDGRRLGFDVTVVEDACAAIDLDGSLEGAWQLMEEAGVKRTSAASVA